MSDRNTSEKLRNDRRRFLRGIAAAGGAAAAASIAGEALAKPAVAPEPAAQQPGGYRETEHVRAYYRSARS